jgi:DUF2075 family protein
MIVYRSTKNEFRKDVDSGEIDSILEARFRAAFNRTTSQKEVESWWNSLNFMANILSDNNIPGNTGIAIETQIPQTSKRIDFILSGFDSDQKGNVIIIELKQWTTAYLTEKDGIVITPLGRGLHETSHPSYQAWSYSTALEDFSETVRNEKIKLSPCAYLHNYEEDTVIRNPFYKKYLDKAPAFLKRDSEKLRNFIKQFVKYGDDGELMYRIDQGKIRPSKQLAAALSSMLKGNEEFILLDEQKLVYETALYLTGKAAKDSKQVMIIKGGPGTGKSVVAINLLVELTKRNLLVQYVTKNAAPRAVYQSKLTGTLSKSRFAALFQSSGTFVDASRDTFDALVVDEAHRLNAKSGMFQNYGENQILEIIRASRCSIFFIDEDQKVTFKDIGSLELIKKYAEMQKAEITELELTSQFRCNGSSAYLSFLDNLLQIRKTANPDLKGIKYDFKVMDNPGELRNVIFEKNKESNSARMVAGYCWDWISKNNLKENDIEFPEYDFSMKWNLAQESMLWIAKPDSVKEIGCIHTCQGLEVDYVGVIVGPDLIYRNGKVLVDPSKRSKMDSSIKGYKKLLSENREVAEEKIGAIIKNTYRTLLTRGIKGCYIYSVDKETNNWLKGLINKQAS